jgi:hypothetical protein
LCVLSTVKLVYLMTKTFLSFIILLNVTLTFGQSDTIRLKNPSFEDTPKRGGEASQGIAGWFDCGKINFPAESPPDIHPNGYWQVIIPPQDGNTYLGMVTRDNGTFESVSVRLDNKLIKNNTYRMSIYLARSPEYFSMSRMTNEFVNYNTPVVLKVWGGTGFCNERKVLYESPPIDHNDWKQYDLRFIPNIDIKSLTISAYYTPNTLKPYNGNILIDNISDIILVKN